ENIKGFYQDKIGCSERCPICSSKCELPDNGHEKHHVTHHLLPAFNGYRDESTKHPTLVVCSEHEIRKFEWAHPSKDPNKYKLEEFLRKFYPKWLPFSCSEPSDEHITKVRAVWWKLKDELCEKYDMNDN